MKCKYYIKGRGKDYMTKNSKIYAYDAWAEQMRLCVNVTHVNECNAYWPLNCMSIINNNNNGKVSIQLRDKSEYIYSAIAKYS